MVIALILACVVQQKNQPDPVTTPSTAIADPAVITHEHQGACLPGIQVEYDTGTAQPYGINVELRYQFGAHIQIPYARFDSILKFQCGNRLDALNNEPQVDGEWVGPVGGYEAMWLEDPP